jgi:hypothetical protein
MELEDPAADAAEESRTACSQSKSFLGQLILLSISPQNVERFRQMLLSEGFRNVGIFQVWKRGQIFGYARQIGANLEWHVRAFFDGSLESEVELPRTSIHHLINRPYLHDGILAQFLSRHRVPFTRTPYRTSRNPPL